MLNLCFTKLECGVAKTTHCLAKTKHGAIFLLRCRKNAPCVVIAGFAVVGGVRLFLRVLVLGTVFRFLRTVFLVLVFVLGVLEILVKERASFSFLAGGCGFLGRG